MILTLKKPSLLDIDMSPVTPELLQRDVSAVHTLPLNIGTEQAALGDLFNVAVDNEDRLMIRGADRCLTRVAAKMNCGEMIVEGDCGDHTAEALSGGVVRIKGSTGACAASGMRGGRLFIEKDAGDSLGSAPIGATHGMIGGDIVVGGQVGARACERMRRGTVVILGDCGDYCANNMIAGTVFALGKIGRSIGYEMRRGTLLIKDRDALDANFFARSGAQTNFMPLLVRYVRSLDRSTQPIPEGYTERYIGDISIGGVGEILVL